MSLRDELERIAAALPFIEGSAVVRVADVVASKSTGYWERRGRERFRRELAEDGLDAALVAEVLATVDDALEPDDPPDLDAILEDLRRRG